MLEDKYDLMSKMVMRPIKIPTKKRNERGNRGKGGAKGAGAGGDNTLAARAPGGMGSTEVPGF